MGVQKSKVSSVHKFTRLFCKIQKKKKYIVMNKQFKMFKYITKFAHLV